MLISIDVVNLFTNVPVDETCDIIKQKLLMMQKWQKLLQKRRKGSKIPTHLHRFQKKQKNGPGQLCVWSKNLK